MVALWLYYKISYESLLTVVLRRRFSWVEISFLSLWWEQATDSMKTRFKKLVDAGQIEFLTGGWVMEDEANTHLYAMIDQVIEGNDFIKTHLNATARSAWSIDPFGLSSTNAYLRKQMGFENMVIQRAHYLVKKYLASNQKLEFRWRQNWDKGSSTDILTHLMTFANAYNFLDTCGPDQHVCCQFEFTQLSTGSPSGCKAYKPKVSFEN